LTAGTSVVQIALGPFLHPAIFSPPLNTTSSPELAG
jgi:hypothetical protein